MFINNSKGIKFDEPKFMQFLQRRGTNQIIRFPEVFQIFSWYRIKKDDAHRVLDDLQKKGIIKIIPFNGIRFVGAVRE
ncbi:MAG: hypothetical protein WA144_12485 [Candidatus Methanoperedens sp.]